MTPESTPESNIEKEPLINSRFVWKISIVVALLLVATLSIYIGGQYFSQSLSNAGHTNDVKRHNVTIGTVTLSFPANQIRFSEQRRSGPTKGINLYVSWPNFQGYSDKDRNLFNTTDKDNQLIFIDIIKADEMADMSGRLELIYRNFIIGTPTPGPEGLMAHQMDPKSSFKDETLYVESLIKERPFVIKCLNDQSPTNPSSSSNPSASSTASSTDCQRDLTFSNKISVSYRYSKNLLPHWRSIEQKLIEFIQNAATPK